MSESSAPSAEIILQSFPLRGWRIEIGPRYTDGNRVKPRLVYHAEYLGGQFDYKECSTLEEAVRFLATKVFPTPAVAPPGSHSRLTNALNRVLENSTAREVFVQTVETEKSKASCPVHAQEPCLRWYRDGVYGHPTATDALHWAEQLLSNEDELKCAEHDVRLPEMANVRKLLK